MLAIINSKLELRGHNQFTLSGSPREIDEDSIFVSSDPQARVLPTEESLSLYSASGSTRRVYRLSFPSGSLGISLLQRGTPGFPIVIDNPKEQKSVPQGEIMLPLAAHKLISIAGINVATNARP